MAKIGESVGIGAAIDVRGDTQAFSRFLGELHRVGAEVADRDGLHLTIVDSYETKTLIKSERDILALNNANSRAMEYLSSIAFKDIFLYPAEPTVQPLGHQRRKFGIIIDDEDGTLEEIRSNISDIFYKEARLRVGRGPGGNIYEPHISTGRRVGRSGSPATQKTKRGLSKIKVPRTIHLKGFSVGERIFRRNDSRPSSRNRGYDRTYINSRPRGRG